LDLAGWQQAQVDDSLESANEDSAYFEAEQPSGFFEDVEGDWPEHGRTCTTCSIPVQWVTRAPIPQIPLALVLTASGWQVPAYLRFDAGFASPAVHAAMAKLWNEKIGAEIVGMLPDLIEMYGARPPTREEALVLAKEQYIYCGNIVVQGTRTLQALAAGPPNGSVWFFWWDGRNQWAAAWYHRLPAKSIIPPSTKIVAPVI
jgi:hypothetical protein